VKTVFLSFHFSDSDKKIAGQVELLLESHHIATKTGEHLGGGKIAPSVQKRIEISDALVAIATADPNQPRAGGKFNTYDWVYDEIAFARDNKKPVAVMVANDVDLGGGMHGDAERIAYDPTAPLDAFLKLSETIGIWKSEAGRSMKLMLINDDLVTALDGNLEFGKCEYRIHPGDRPPTTWITASLRGEGVGAIVAFAKGLQDDDLIEVRVETNVARWYSRSEPQLIKVQMMKRP
jgi:hypothetical protein